MGFLVHHIRQYFKPVRWSLFALFPPFEPLSVCKGGGSGVTTEEGILEGLADKGVVNQTYIVFLARMNVFGEARQARVTAGG